MKKLPYNVLPATLIKQSQQTEMGKAAKCLGRLIYNSYQDGEFVKIHGKREEIIGQLTNAQTLLEHEAMKEILAKYFS